MQRFEVPIYKAVLLALSNKVWIRYSWFCSLTLFIFICRLRICCLRCMFWRQWQKLSKMSTIWISKMPGYQGNFSNAWGIREISQIPTDIWGWSIFKMLEISQMTRNFQDTQVFGEFPKRNFPKTYAFGKLPKYPVIWAISKILKIYLPQIPIGIWGISQMPGYLGNFPNSQVSGKFLKCLGFLEISKILKIYRPQIPTGIWGISQMPEYLGNFPNAWVSQKLTKGVEFLRQTRIF